MGVKTGTTLFTKTVTVGCFLKQQYFFTKNCNFVILSYQYNLNIENIYEHKCSLCLIDSMTIFKSNITGQL